MFKNYCEMLSKTDLFNGIASEDIPVMLDCLKPIVQKFNKNDHIINEGNIVKSIGLVLDGEVVVCKENASGNRTILTILNQGDIFGEIIAFSDCSTWPATVQAQSSCEILFLSKTKIINECSNLCGWHRTLIQNFLRIISQRALMLNKKVEYLSIKSIQAKISTYLLEQYRQTGKEIFSLSLNRSKLAEFLNISRPSMSREMCKMRDEGIIDFHLNTFKILNVDALRAISDLSE